ncbi:unnamed protein product (macronuclear) [Paramecium tetraurelia]|uniref:Uncharacterized protein n=1 Tax=Paramecium tetraurelia TaxID=5888 RepID=A0EDK5_PARTE|nr:uncharacterized protein GSPATT00025715001 [Paramecium tetraurelia]CAK93372.1 unnamed protein product [Paramecium tetraurelia]|eukprot:XP_001460769.1 hypothetical protein (macronuclear) [Paramecium tetraurelia strain d4-2]
MGICDSKSIKKSPYYSKQSTGVTPIPIINKIKQHKRCKTITFWDAKIAQNEVESNQKSYSPPPKLCFCSSNQGSNSDIQYGQSNLTKERLNQVNQNKQSKQTLFGKKVKFSNSLKRGQRELFKPLASNQ